MNMTEIEALDIMLYHRKKHQEEKPNSLLTDEALKTSIKALKQLLRFHEMTDNLDKNDTIPVNKLRKYVLEGKK